jgi:hypothetical protein
VLQTVASNCGWNTNSACDLPFNNSNVVNYLQTASNNSWSNITFALSAPSENDASYWKKFTSADTSLTVYFNYVPGVPTVSLGGAVTCPDPANPGQTVTYVGTQNPSITAQATSYNGQGSKVDLHFEAIGHPTSDPTLVRSATAHYIDGSPAAVATWYSPNLAKAPYSLHAYASTSAETNVTPLNSAWSNYIDFTVAPDAPTVPTIQSFTYPSLYWGAPTDHPGTFNLSGPSGIAGFAYSLDNNNMPAPQPNDCTYTGTSTNGSGEPSGFAPATTTGTGTLTMPVNVRSGFHTLYVWDFSRAHVPSAASATPYKFYVAPAAFTAPATTSSSTLYEAESMTPTSHQTGDYVYTETNNAASGSKDVQLAADNTFTNPSYTFSFTPSVSGTQPVGIELLTGTHNATATFKVNGNTAVDSQGHPIVADTCASSAGTMFQPLGGFNLDATKTNTITVTMGVPDSSTTTNAPYPCANGYAYPSSTVAGAPPSGHNDNGYSLGVDYIISAPLSVTYANLQSAFNNHGIGVDGATTNLASLDMTSNNLTSNNGLANNALSKSALSAAGFTQGGTMTINNPASGTGPVTFSIPAATNGSDNVVAAGQIITWNQSLNDTYASPGYVDLLVSSTCGQIPQSAAHAIHLSLTDSTGQNPQPDDNLNLQIPNWTDTPGNYNDGDNTYISPIVAPNSSTTTPYYLTGASSQRTNTAANLYLLQVPVPQGGYNYPLTLKTISLPNIELNNASTCPDAPNALHVFALATSPN